MDETEKLIADAIKYHGIDVPVHAIRLSKTDKTCADGDMVIITIQGGQELSCKLSQLQSRPVCDLLNGETKNITSETPGKEPGLRPSTQRKSKGNKS